MDKHTQIIERNCLSLTILWGWRLKGWYVTKFHFDTTLDSKEIIESVTSNVQWSQWWRRHNFEVYPFLKNTAYI